MTINVNNINNLHNNGIDPKQQADKQNASQKTESQTTPSKNSGESVEFSEQTQRLNQLKEAALNAPEINSEKVAEIKKAIEDGSYQIDANSVAKKMIDLEDSLKG